MLKTLYGGILRKAARHYRSKPFAMRNMAPLVSFTFDDVPDSAASYGAPLLESYGVRGTFYVAGGTLGRDDAHWNVIAPDQVRTLARDGHEIGCHTFSHVAVDTLDEPAMELECEQNRSALRDIVPGLELANFCYPFGRASLPRKLQLQNRFDTCRGIYEGVNCGTIDLAMLKAVELYDRTLTQHKLQRVLRAARANNAWVIFYTHDVTTNPSWIGCSPHLLRDTLETVLGEGIACLSIRDALAAIGYRTKTVSEAAAA